MMRVSVIIPTYNYGRYLRECVESVLGQTVLPDEIVIVDDGSTDNTPEIVKPYLSNPLIKYIRTENAGVSTARNTGIAASTGDIIGLLDADDKWRSDKIELQLPLFSNPNVGVVYSLSQRFDENGPATEHQRVSPRRGQVLDALMSNNIVPLSSAMVRRKCFEKVGVFNKNLTSCEDFDLWARMSVHGVEFDYVDHPLMLYRTGHASLISDVNRHYRQSHTLLCELFAGPGREKCTSQMKRTAWAFYFAKSAYAYYETNNRYHAFVDSIRSICHRPFGVLDGMAWRTLVKCLLPNKGVALLKRYRYGD